MPTIIPKTWWCGKCKTEVNKKVCSCGTRTKPVPPYSVRFRWIDESGRESHKRITGTPPWETMKAAQKGYEEWIAVHPSGTKKDALTVDFMPLYEEYKAHLRANVKESSFVTLTNRMDTHILPYFRDKKVTDISPADILKWQNALTEKGFSVKYKNALRGAFNHFFSYLKIYKINNPLSDVKGFKKTLEAKKEMKFWTREEFERFIAVVDDFRFKAVFCFLYLTGCRKGEALALKWSDIDFEARTVSIRSTLSHKVEKGRDRRGNAMESPCYIITPPKTANSYRDILLPSNLLDVLRRLHGGKTSDFVFGKDGSFMPFNTLDHAFARYIALSGVPPIRVHDLRHSHASLLINTGENQLSAIYVIANRLGDTVDMVFKTYGHLFPNSQKEVIDRINFPIE